jgi:hypothetical protein
MTESAVVTDGKRCPAIHNVLFGHKSLDKCFQIISKFISKCFDDGAVLLGSVLLDFTHRPHVLF